MSIPSDHHVVAGDVITVAAVVDLRSPPGELIHARVGSAYGMPISVNRDDATLVRTHLAVGDQVHHDVPEGLGLLVSVGTIVAIADERAWVAWACGLQNVLALSRLRRVCIPVTTETAPHAPGA